MDKARIYEDGTYQRVNSTWHEEDSPWKADQIKKIIATNKINPLTICEIGCGAGGILNCLADYYGSNVFLSGYEISPQAFEICKKKEKENLRFFLKNLTNEDINFDLVLAIDVLEHVEDYLGFLAELKKMGTYKILHIPLDLSVQSVLRSTPILHCRESVGHIHYFTKETALATLKDAGYEIIDYFYTSGSVERPNRSWKTKLLKFPRMAAFNIHQGLAVRILGGFSLLVLAK